MGGTTPVDPNAPLPDYTAAFVLVGVGIPLGYAIAVIISLIQSRRNTRDRERAAVATKVLRESYTKIWFPWRDAVRLTEPESADARVCQAQTEEEAQEDVRTRKHRDAEDRTLATRREAGHRHEPQAWQQPWKQQAPSGASLDGPSSSKSRPPWRGSPPPPPPAEEAVELSDLSGAKPRSWTRPPMPTTPPLSPPSPTGAHFHGDGDDDDDDDDVVEGPDTMEALARAMDRSGRFVQDQRRYNEAQGIKAQRNRQPRDTTSAASFGASRSLTRGGHPTRPMDTAFEDGDDDKQEAGLRP